MDSEPLNDSDEETDLATETQEEDARTCEAAECDGGTLSVETPPV